VKPQMPYTSYDVANDVDEIVRDKDDYRGDQQQYCCLLLFRIVLAHPSFYGGDWHSV